MNKRKELLGVNARDQGIGQPLERYRRCPVVK